MDNPIENIIFSSERSPDQSDDLRRALADDAGLAAAYERWQDIRAAVREDLENEIGDPRLFVLLALYHGGHADQLTSDEIAAVRDAVDQFEQVIKDRPALGLIAADIVDAAAAFSSMWDANVTEGAFSESIIAEERAPAVSPATGKFDAENRPKSDARSRIPKRPMRPALHASRRQSNRTAAARWGVRVAIGVAFIVFAFVLTQVLQRESGMTTIESGAGESLVVELAEGSRVRLLESSKLSYPHPQSISPLTRQATLEGRAYFEISPSDRGFIVKTSNARVTVLGTSFGIESRNSITEVVLTEGRLTLAAEARLRDFVLLEPGQMSRVAADGAPAEPIDVDISDRLAWTGLFIFKSTPMRTISQRLSGYFGVPVTVDQSLVDERVTGTFDQKQPLQAILDVIADAVGASVQEDPAGGYVLTLP